MNKKMFSLKAAVHWRVNAKVAALAHKLDFKRRLEIANAKAVSKPLQALSRKEKLEFKNSWKNWNSVSYEFYKAFGCPFNVGYVPNDYYDFAEHVLNLRWSAFFLQHKCSLKYIIPAENRPVSILQKIDGHYVFEDNTEITEAESIRILSQENEFVCKVAMGSGGGHGVQKITQSNAVDFSALLKPNDLIFQKIIHQHECLSQFNPDSVNTFRLLTLNLNGECSVLSSFLRMGAKGSFVDNLSTGGGVLVGIDQDGRVNEFGINKKYEKVFQAPSGISFSGLQIPNWLSIKEKTIKFHQHIPYANLIGWDITLNEAGEPIVIEINLDHAEIEAHQIFNGPVFGERLQEVKAYIEKRTPQLRRAIITY